MTLFKVMGEHKTPQQETPESILKYAKKNNFYYDYLFMPINDSAIIEIIKRNYFILGGILPFDSLRRPIVVKTITGEEKCPHSIAFNFQSQDSAIVGIGSDTLEFWDRLSLMKLVDKRTGLPDLCNFSSDYDYYLIGIWAKMLPKVARNVHEDFRDALSLDSTKRICIISLNYDANGGNDFYGRIFYNKK